jgi:DNA-binding NtrC family response regulator
MQRDLILCVDDELILLQTFAIAIPRSGFRVAVAEDGAAGLELFLQRRDEICLVLTDLIMPVMNGIDMVGRILKIEPQMKILLMSAYSDDSIFRQIRRMRLPFIRKPFHNAALIEKIRSTIDVQEPVTSAK